MPRKRTLHPVPRFELEDADLVFVQLTSLEAITDGDGIYVNSSGYAGRARANASATMFAVGVAAETFSSGIQGRVITQGLKSSANYNFSGYMGRNAYVSTGTAGGVQTTPPASSGQISQVIGQMIFGSSLWVAIQGAVQVGQTL